MYKILIAALLGILFSLTITYLLFEDLMIIPAFIGAIAFMTAYKNLEAKKTNKL